MHYIIGTQLRVSTRSSTGESASVRLVTEGTFKPGIVYNLYHIAKDRDEKIRYIFISDDQTDVVAYAFDTITTADKYISRLRGESLPDYEQIYSRNTT